MNTSNPPAYSPSEDFTDLPEKAEAPILLPHEDEPGFAAASSLSRGLQVPSRTRNCTSGFEYPEELSHYGVSQDNWADFTQVVCEEAKLSRQQWTTVIGKGLGTFAVGGLMIGLFGAVPAIFVARNARRRQEQRNLIYALAGAQGERLSRHISSWNETFFRQKGILIRVDLPDEYLNDVQNMNIHTSASSLQSSSKVRDKAGLKARIVIIPLDRPESGLSSQDARS
ncbi:uncharacterized protein N7511_003466 [Penicillium nucicola]|uniref:uncharacterized protein n=1 Tax=Penicillium nucicola TaxID=1850975 RepID=UPI00254565D8|nr:uncharacterized protein N7511_003466 [Penicillium nucicola]KAJ5771415.1 hypothetical protein N7511_003466 [Penicillium nucicola]